jgi:hypothetical protein
MEMPMTPKSQRGLYYNINNRREAGLPPKKPGQEGYPTRQAFIDSKKTAKNARAHKR